MSLNLETILQGVKADVVVLDRRRQIVYRNHPVDGDAILTAAVLAAVDMTFSQKKGFEALEASAAVADGDSGVTDIMVSGEYVEMPDGEYVVLTLENPTRLQKEKMALSEALEKAKSEAAMKMSYLANMSHEIRTPVNAISGFSRLISQSADKQQQAAYAEIIDNNTKMLLQLIDDVLDIAKMEEGRLQFRKKVVELNELMRSVESTVRMRVQSHTVFNYVLGAAECKIETDPGRLSQVLINLLTNACKFTPRGSITFGYEVREQSVYFFVKDTGYGISPEKQALLFKRFSKQNDVSPGTGLGLSICKNIIDTFNGEIGVESAGEGRGSLFWFTLPVTPIETEALEPVSVDKILSPSQTASDKNDNRPLLLIAEDNESNYLLFQMILEKDYRLAHAWNGREVVDMFPKTNPDLILMDINMPFMDGYEATRHIRQRSTTVPIIAVTAYAFSSDKARIMENGFNSYVSKPINTDRLLGEIKRCIG